MIWRNDKSARSDFMKNFLVSIAGVVLIGAGCANQSNSEVMQKDPVIVHEEPAKVESASTSIAQVQAKSIQEEHGSKAPTLTERIADYEVERESCIAQRLKEVEGGILAGLRDQAEHYCTIVVMSPKYYASDPEGIIELCVREAQVSGYTKAGGFMAGISREELDQVHALGLQSGVTMDDSGVIQIDEATFKSWRNVCRGVIEINKKKNNP